MTNCQHLCCRSIKVITSIFLNEAYCGPHSSMIKLPHNLIRRPFARRFTKLILNTGTGRRIFHSIYEISGLAQFSLHFSRRLIVTFFAPFFTASEIAFFESSGFIFTPLIASMSKPTRNPFFNASKTENLTQ